MIPGWRLDGGREAGTEAAGETVVKYLTDCVFASVSEK